MMDTNATIRGELYPAAAPNTVGNFIKLANSGFYDRLSFHRCIPNFIIQGGRGSGAPPYCIAGEFEFNGRKRSQLPHRLGSLCMSRAGHYNSGFSQFYIMVTDNQRELDCLDGAYTVFGQVTDGLKAAEAIAQVETDESFLPLNEQVIRRIRVETFGIEYPFETVEPPKSDINEPVVHHRERNKK
ncbi:MAG: peptidylprolyl isomerase [Eubacteriales bacterium]|nr:peptidylprolyl isomerase [Eubacteriales bacterium]